MIFVSVLVVKELVVMAVVQAGEVEVELLVEVVVTVVVKAGFMVPSVELIVGDVEGAG